MTESSNRPNNGDQTPSSPTSTLTVKTMSDCPRCNLALQNETYEGTELLFCGSCWGHWVGFGAFKTILMNEVYEFSENDSKTILKKWAQHESGEKLTEKINCPDCNKEMRQMDFADECPVLVDRCEDHGVWLDCAEIKEIQIFLDELRANG